MEKEEILRERTQYQALRRFAKVIASVANLQCFAQALTNTPADKWNLYFEISTGKEVKKENKQLFCQLMNFVTLMELLEINIYPNMLKNSFNLSIIEKTGKMPQYKPAFELVISQSSTAMDRITSEVMKDYEGDVEKLWSLWLFEVQLLTYSNGEAPSRVPQIFLGENKKQTQQNLVTSNGKICVLQRIVEWNCQYCGEITQFVADIWDKFPELRESMIEFGYKK